MVGAGEAGPRHDGGQGPAGGGGRQSAWRRPPGHHGGVQWAEVTHGKSDEYSAFICPGGS